MSSLLQRLHLFVSPITHKPLYLGATLGMLLSQRLYVFQEINHGIYNWSFNWVINALEFFWTVHTLQMSTTQYYIRNIIFITKYHLDINPLFNVHSKHFCYKKTYTYRTPTKSYSLPMNQLKLEAKQSFQSKPSHPSKLKMNPHIVLQLVGSFLFCFWTCI